MKKSKKILCIVLVFILLFDLSSVSFAIFDDIDKGIWDKTWESKTEATEAAVTMFVGNDENDRTIAWYSDIEEGYVELKSIKGSEKINATAKINAVYKNIDLSCVFLLSLLICLLRCKIS